MEQFARPLATGARDHALLASKHKIGYRLRIVLSMCILDSRKRRHLAGRATDVPDPRASNEF
jgi:hypothetical protein